MRTAVLAVAATLATTASAAPLDRGDDTVVIGRPQPGDLGYRGSRHDAAGPDVLYVNRCTSGCTLTPGDRNSDSSRDNISSIAQINATVPPFPYGDATWDTIISCVRDVYKPYGVEVVSEPPPDTVRHVEMMVGGRAPDIGLSQPAGGTLLGIAPSTGDCSLGGYWIAFTFAASHANDPIELCATIAHEAGHVFGLEHVFECSDPMTYITGCGTKYFRNLNMPCGTDAAVPCRCPGATSNTHSILLHNVGRGVDVPPPQVSIAVPAAGPVQPGFSLFVNATDPRGVHDLEVLVNGWSWLTAPGVWQKVSPYRLDLPAEVPPGVMDIEVRACGDTGACASATVTVTEGAPCVDTSLCLEGQTCDAGRCLWAPASIEQGGACTFDEACLTELCGDLGDGQRICTVSCQGPPNDFCPDGFACNAGTGEFGVCAPIGGGDGGDEGGCCQVDQDGSAPMASLALGGLVALVLRRRTRRRATR